MESTNPGGSDEAPVKRAEKSSAGINKERPIGRDCHKCLTYLTRALDRVGERPQSLLRALGVISHGDTNGRKLYEPTEDGRGVLISLDNGKDTASKGLIRHDGSHTKKNQLQRTDVSVNRGSGDSIPSLPPDDTEDQHSALRRRFTEAATLLVDGIRHSAEDILSHGTDMPNGGVLTTSPAVKSTQPDQDQFQTPSRNVTTIAVECQTCGSDTRAEAGARAFVRGPEPLSIVLCSNRLSSQREVDEVLVHELIHIYDVHSRKMDLRDCKQLAHSEVRAAREAECSNSFAQFTANICVKDKATVATRNMFPDEGKKCVCDVFTEAMNDMAPFNVKSGYAKGNNNSPSPRQNTPLSTPRQSER